MDGPFCFFYFAKTQIAFEDWGDASRNFKLNMQLKSKQSNEATQNATFAMMVGNYYVLCANLQLKRHTTVEQTTKCVISLYDTCNF